MTALTRVLEWLALEGPRSVYLLKHDPAYYTASLDDHDTHLRAAGFGSTLEQACEALTGDAAAKGMLP